MSGSKNDRRNRSGVAGEGHVCMIKVMRGTSGKLKLERDTTGVCKRLTGR